MRTPSLTQMNMVMVKGRDEEEFDLLSEIIHEINEYYGKVPEGTEESSKS